MNIDVCFSLALDSEVGPFGTPSYEVQFPADRRDLRGVDRLAPSCPVHVVTSPLNPTP